MTRQFAGAFKDAEPRFQGHLRSFEPGRRSLLKRLKLGTVILSIAALVGAVEVIYNRYDRLFDWFFGKPSLRLAAGA